MKGGIALTDEDREPWLYTLAAIIKKGTQKCAHDVHSSKYLADGHSDYKLEDRDVI